VAGPELEWVDYDISLAALMAPHVRSFTRAPGLEVNH
jgi:hypothetical protein